jgi:DNA (cytosine-5)-methyltransferase 1
MFPEAIRAVREARPKAFIFENVKGLTRSTFRNYFEYVRLQLQYPDIVARRDESIADHHARLERHHTGNGKGSLTYRIVTQLVNAANYGIPQKRERVFFVGFREDLGVEWNFPEETHSAQALAWDPKKRLRASETYAADLPNINQRSAGYKIYPSRICSVAT